MREAFINTRFAPEESLKLRNRFYSIHIPRSRQWKFFTAALVLNDFSMMLLAFRLAYFLRFETSIAIFNLEVQPPVFLYSTLSLLVPLAMFGIFIFSGLYNRRNLLGGTREYSMIFNSTTFIIVAMVAAGFLEPSFVIARGWLLLVWVFMFGFTLLGRFLIRRVVYSLRGRGYFLSPTLLVGANTEGCLLAEQLMCWTTSGLMIQGYLDDNPNSDDPILKDLDHLGPLSALDAMVSKYQIEELVLTSSALNRQQIMDIFTRYGVSDNINLRMSSGLYEVITTSLDVREFASVPLVGVNKVRLTGIDLFLKTLLDYGLLLVTAVLVIPLMGILALLVRLDSPGPVIYRRRVMGVNGKQFDAFKFRSMYVNSDQILDQYPDLKKELALNQKLKKDPRVTRIGRIIRKTSLDELPQLINVLIGQMSIVGPRMISPAEMEKYNQWGMNLLTVKPGLTGLWQVSGRSDVCYEDRVRLDMTYVRNWSIWLDLSILWQTIPAVLKGKGAY